MALRIVEFFGFPPGDPRGSACANERRCPFVNDKCIKPDHGACSLQALQDPEPVICCPNRLYAENFQVLNQVADLAFGAGTSNLPPKRVKAMGRKGELTGDEVAVFGKYWGGELPLPKAMAGTGSYYVDWILARIGPAGLANEMTALEVQTIDTTGSYLEQAEAYFAGQEFTDRQGRTPGYSNAGFNWENVNKRILPQVIYKGHVLRRESKATKGMFFVCPKHVADRIHERLGGIASMHTYEPSAGTITFVSYGLGPAAASANSRKLILLNRFTTTIDQVAIAFTSPKNLPPAKVYESAVNTALS